MDLIKICESDNWVVRYDRERGMYRVSYFDDDYFVDECLFDCYEEKEAKTPYWEVFLRGAAEFMQYLKNNYRYGIFPSEIEGAMIGFSSQFGEVKDINT